jgi:hypothetical protein
MWTGRVVQTWETRNAKYIHNVDGKSLQKLSFKEVAEVESLKSWDLILAPLSLWILLSESYTPCLGKKPE